MYKNELFCKICYIMLVFNGILEIFLIGNILHHIKALYFLIYFTIHSNDSYLNFSCKI